MELSDIQTSLKAEKEEVMQKKTTVQRSVLTVIDELLKEIPYNEEKIIDEILCYNESLWNKAPEVLRSSECWFPLQCILSKYILDFDAEWKIKVLAVFNGF